LTSHKPSQRIRRNLTVICSLSVTFCNSVSAFYCLFGIGWHRHDRSLRGLSATGELLAGTGKTPWGRCRAFRPASASSAPSPTAPSRRRGRRSEALNQRRRDRGDLGAGMGRLGDEIILLNCCKWLQINSTFFTVVRPGKSNWPTTKNGLLGFALSVASVQSVVNSALGCGFAALGSLWFNYSV
jgi:hypothetical protein